MAGATTRRNLVALGIVGTSPLWEPHYHEAFRRLSHRVIIRGVYDAVPARAELTAREWPAVIAPSLTNLFERPELDGVVILDSAWHGLFPLELACRYAKPTLLAGRWEGELSRQEKLYLAARDAGITLMTAFPRRHTPATNRLRELLATKLGAPKRIVVECVTDSEIDIHELTGLIDWCISLIGKAPQLVTAEDTLHGRRMTFAFPAARGIDHPIAEILLRTSPCDPAEFAGEVMQVECQHGQATLHGLTDLTWQIGSGEVREDLQAERSSTEILLDQFCRRLVGGLVPVADLADALRALRLADAARAGWK